MEGVHPSRFKYLGLDVVHSQIEKLKQANAHKTNYRFEFADISSTKLHSRLELPYDAIFVRDVFQHLTFYAIFKSLYNMGKFNVKYAILQTYPKTTLNSDIEYCGQLYHEVNLETYPFNIKFDKTYLELEYKGPRNIRLQTVHEVGLDGFPTSNLMPVETTDDPFKQKHLGVVNIKYLRSRAAEFLRLALKYKKEYTILQ